MMTRAWQEDENLWKRAQIQHVRPPFVISSLVITQLSTALTERDDEKADVAQPIGRLIGQLIHEESQNSAEVTLIARHGHLNGGRSLSITITAVGGVT